MLAALAEQIQATARLEQAALSQLAGQQRQAVERQLAWQVGAMRAERAVKLAALLADLEAQQAEVEQAFAAARAALQQQIAQQQLAARTDAEEALGHLRHAALAPHVRHETAGGPWDAADHGAAGPGRRPTAEPSAARHRARTAAAEGWPARGQIVRDGISAALSRSALDIIAVVQQRSAALARGAQGAAPAPAPADPPPDAAGELERSIRRSTEAAIEQIEKLGRASGKQLGALEEQALAALDDAAQVARSRVQQATEGSLARLERAGQEVLRQLAEREAADLAALDRGAAAATDRLLAARPDAELSDGAAQQLARVAARWLREIRTTAGAALLEQAGRFVASLLDAMGSVAAHVGEATKLVRTCIGEAATTARATAAVLGGLETRCEVLRAELREAARREAARRAAAREMSARGTRDGGRRDRLRCAPCVSLESPCSSCSRARPLRRSRHRRSRRRPPSLIPRR